MIFLFDPTLRQGEEMPNRSKDKGSNFERELLVLPRLLGMEAQRAWGSDGKSLGLPSDVDVVIRSRAGHEWRVQAKRRAKLPTWLQIPTGVDVVVMREDFGKAMALVWYDDLLELISHADG